jgi:uncharacterized protein with PIN domain
MSPAEIRFAADGMLQSLGTWLRLLGYDCAGGGKLFGRRLLEQAVSENRIFLTRNLHLGEYLPKLLLERAEIAQVAAERLPEQLREVTQEFSLDPNAYFFTRCLKCNESLQPLPKDAALGRVPPNAASLHEIFWGCPRCEKVFWRGSHVTNSLQRLHKWLAESPPSKAEV